MSKETFSNTENEKAKPLHKKLNWKSNLDVRVYDRAIVTLRPTHGKEAPDEDEECGDAWTRQDEAQAEAEVFEGAEATVFTHLGFADSGAE